MVVVLFWICRPRLEQISSHRHCPPCPSPAAGRPIARRLMFFEQAREQAEREFKANNKDAMVGG